MGKGRAPCCDKTKVKRGPWTPAEDFKLTSFINNHGHSNWRALPKQAGLLRCGKSCRLRWINYLSPDVRRGNFTPQEHLTIINLHNTFGNKWSKIASYLPGRTDNEIKNVWNTHLKKRLTNNTNKCHEAEASPSCASSTITSAGGQKVENAPGQPKEKSQFLEGKEIKTTFDDSPTSSHASNVSSMPNTALEFGLMNPAQDDGKIEIPLDSGVDFWEVFGSLLDEDPTDIAEDITEISSTNSPEKLEWIRFMEDELGLTSDKDSEIVPTDVMNSEPPLETGPGLDTFPIWPSSPHIY